MIIFYLIFGFIVHHTAGDLQYTLVFPKDGCHVLKLHRTFELYPLRKTKSVLCWQKGKLQ